MESKGWIAGHRRHIPGPGDWLFLHPSGAIPLLVECKATKHPFDEFGPADRREMTDFCEANGLRGMLAWRIPRGKGAIRWVPQEGWPSGP